MRVSNQIVLPVSLSIGMLVFCSMPTSVLADKRPGGLNKNDEAEIQVVIPIGEDSIGDNAIGDNAIGDNKGAVTDKDIRSQMLSEKLIKMGRARSQSCTRCHGRSGMAALASSINWERSIAEFVVKQLTELREGKRVHAVMSSIAEPLSDQDIALIATWYQSVSPDSENK